MAQKSQEYQEKSLSNFSRLEFIRKDKILDKPSGLVTDARDKRWSNSILLKKSHFIRLCNMNLDNFTELEGQK